VVNESATIDNVRLPQLPGLVVNRLIELKSEQSIVENRRWFSSSDVDLIVWTDETQAITAFEFYYDKHLNEHVLMWSEESGFGHLAVDDGERRGVLNYKEAPVLIPDGTFDPDRIKHLFERSQDGLPTPIGKAIRQKLGKLTVDIQET